MHPGNMLYHNLFRDKNVLLCMNGHDHGDDIKFVDDIPYYTVNSAAYVWCGCQITNEEKLREKYADLNGFLLYRQALCVNVEIDENHVSLKRHKFRREDGVARWLEENYK